MGLRKSKISNQLKYNLKLFLDYFLIEKGFYTNIDVSELDFLDRDLSKLFVTDDLYTWQAPKKNWVYDDNLDLSPGMSSPILPSGVYINGNFYNKTDSTYGHVYNYKDGQVIFTSGTAPKKNDIVQLSYSYKNFYVDVADKKTALSLANDYFTNDNIEDSVFPSGEITTPSVIIEGGALTLTPYALGGGVIANKQIHLHLVSNDAMYSDLEDVADYLTFLKYSTLTLIDLDKIPELFTYYGDKASTFVDYKTLISDSNYTYTASYVLDAERVDLFSERPDWNRIRIDTIFEFRGVDRS